MLRIALIGLTAAHTARVRRVLPGGLIGTCLPTLAAGVPGAFPILVHLVFRLLPRLLAAFLFVGHVTARTLATSLACIAGLGVGVVALICAPVLIVSHDRIPLFEHRKVCVHL
ncbi:MAG: hypothetical protein WCC62_03150 [Pseudomonas capeferrum]